MLHLRRVFSAKLISIVFEMCILYVMIEPSPRPGGLKLVVCSIRDEFFQRPTALAHEWPSGPGMAELLGGKWFLDERLFVRFIILICKFTAFRAPPVSSEVPNCWILEARALRAY